MKRRVMKFKNIRIQKLAEFYILLGLSIVFSLILTKLCIENNRLFSDIFNYLSAGEMTIFIIALVVLIQGLYIFSNPETITHSELKKLRVMINYLIILTFIWNFHAFNNKGGEFKEIYTYYYVCLFTIFWLSILYEFTKLIKAIKSILKNNVTDSKDRLSIVITLIATLISAIALFK
ncbi:hypothetical protein B1B04_18855 [Lysinibacillus sp. KCTC 33748]|uniref:hypothetical protein n=1 Tax=unclassified Lysinibacillus TaxID=2636778 RepID=UPI0009A8F614|nr:MULTISPECIES: hypothetical protein [unclassified Lysinibacillus]OXS70224.1 hypothetical protein B1B04_18855 [Lysinibacillus sp. KCTC 33748]SKC04878.1 hypothetical protein SAMN06295926_11960 [Lysinibacillus sp. AC-3]